MNFLKQISDGGKFINKGGSIGCDNSRAAGYGTGKNSELVVKMNGNEQVKIWAGYAMGHEAVKRTTDLVLAPLDSSSNRKESEL